LYDFADFAYRLGDANFTRVHPLVVKLVQLKQQLALCGHHLESDREILTTPSE
jgi:hypothetical protein